MKNKGIPKFLPEIFVCSQLLRSLQKSMKNTYEDDMDGDLILAGLIAEKLESLIKIIKPSIK